MYNSIVVGGLVNLWNLFYNSYEESFLKKIIDKPKNVFSYLFKNSILGKLLTSKDSLILKSLFYKMYSKIVEFADKLFGKLNSFFTNVSREGLIYANIKSLFKDNGKSMKTISLFIVSLLTGIILIGISVSSINAREVYIMSVVVLILMGFSSINFLDNYKDVLKESLMWRFVSSLFTIDKGGENWW